MSGTFTARVVLGNAGMRTATDVAHVLTRVAAELHVGKVDGTIRDYNGNRVGEYTLTMDEGSPWE